jgi:hypothetical protein
MEQLGMDNQRIENRVQYTPFGGHLEQTMRLVEVNRPEPTSAAVWRHDVEQTPWGFPGGSVRQAPRPSRVSGFTFCCWRRRYGRP